MTNETLVLVSVRELREWQTALERAESGLQAEDGGTRSAVVEAAREIEDLLRQDEEE